MILSGPNLSITAIGNDNDYAKTIAGAGGVVGIGAAVPSTSNTSTTTAGVGSSALITLTGSGSGAFVLSASHTAEAGTQVVADAGGVLSGAGASINNDISSNVKAQVEASTRVYARSINISATNRTDVTDNSNGTTGGVVSAAGSNSDAEISLTTTVSIGDHANLEVLGLASDYHTFVLSALNIVNASDNVVFKTGGVLAGAGADATVRAMTDQAQVSIGAGATLDTVGALDLLARGQGDVEVNTSVDTYGVGTVSTGTTRAELHPLNQVIVSSGAQLNALGDLNLAAGRSYDESMVDAADTYIVHSRWDGFAGSLIPIDDVNALAFLVQENQVTIDSGAYLSSGRQANLYAQRLSVADMIGKATAVSWVSDVANALNNLLGGGGAEQFSGQVLSEAHGSVTMNGTIETGKTRNQTLTLTWDSANHTVVVASGSSSSISFTESIQGLQNDLVTTLKQDEYMLATYGPTNSTLQSFYQGEITRIQAELYSEGLYETQGGVTIYPSVQVLTITINPIWAQAGLIDVRTGQLQGTGTFIAPTDTSVTINNETPAFLDLLGITIPILNGGVYLNGILVKTNLAINSSNQADAYYNNAHNFSGVVWSRRAWQVSPCPPGRAGQAPPQSSWSRIPSTSPL